MALYKVFGVTLLAVLSSCEPPVQGYNYQAPRNRNSYNGYNAPTNSYLPPNSGISAPSNNYLPPSFGANYAPSGPTGNYNGDTGYANTGTGYAGHGHDHDHHGHNDHEVPKSYEFGYSVKDAQSGNDYGRQETSDGNTVRGEYRVQLPDGRTQIVTYHADWQTGFHADVRYEGEAKYPEPTHHQQQGGYNYDAPNDFRGSLTGFQGNSYKPSNAYGPPSYH